MKTYKWNIILSISLLCFAFVSCKKNDEAAVISHLTLFNAMPGNIKLMPSFKGTDPLERYASAQLFYYATFNELGKYAITKEEQPLTVYSYPDTLPTSKPLFELNLKIKKGSINRLYFTGTAAHPDYLLSTFVPPAYTAADSTFGIRFLNLSYQSKPVNVYLVSNGERKEVEGLAYKAGTEYKRYAAPLETGDYIFEFRDQETQKLLASYTTNGVGVAKDNLWRFRNFTLALIGSAGETTEVLKQKPFLFNDY
ncbi:DUF4397 domain-containing protein [Pedobacter steynii]|uniref:DUF4397 domain-containing protein n=1 Tax=Pedobacter steynii TaxID=430522 RepID=A0A1D7QNI3_9SPHI|nr:DUF4397 domain-containing protein [Pedobacter steynii]AOM80228.1 hypothetical protein BFS30_25535 [Pedobacter steynii]